ncbi:unnamed protein product [Dibothriocephalus latus]|uniref:Uncharacterized protein n=1 Tax=Dibothriocephalus latus TaxID=60516 RepID=A0A3P7L5C9_DIBLA|nr:unnamed protein product [Dibothriocephalus latus]
MILFSTFSPASTTNSPLPSRRSSPRRASCLTPRSSAQVFNRQRTEQPQESFDSQKYAVPGLPWFEPSLSPQASDLEAEEEEREQESEKADTSKPELISPQFESGLNLDDISPEFHTARSYDLAELCQETSFAISQSFEEVILTEVKVGTPAIQDQKILKAEAMERAAPLEMRQRKEAWRNQPSMLADKDGDIRWERESSLTRPSVDSGITSTNGTQVSTTRGLSSWSSPVTTADEEKREIKEGHHGEANLLETELEQSILLSLTCLYDKHATSPIAGPDSARSEASVEELDSPASVEDCTLTDGPADVSCLEDDGTDRDFDDDDVIGKERGLGNESEDEDGETGHPVSMFYRLEQMRSSLEETLGTETLLRCYNVVHALQENEDDEMRLSKEAVAKIMGPEKAAVYFDRVLQLVLADSAFTGGKFNTVFRLISFQ